MVRPSRSRLSSTARRPMTGLYRSRGMSFMFGLQPTAAVETSLVLVEWARGALQRPCSALETPLAIVSKNVGFVPSAIRPEPCNILRRLTYLERLAKMPPRSPAFRSANIC
jgi:hypothetical protein